MKVADMVGKLPFLVGLLLIIAELMAIVNGAYIGCYLENRRRREFTHNPGGIALGTVTPARCYTVCGGLKYSFAAVGSGRFCFCSNTMPDPGRIQADDAKCSTPCDGDMSQLCGSTTHIRVFDAVPPVHISIDATPPVLQTGSPVTLTPTVVTTGPGYNIRMNYGDTMWSTLYRDSGDGLWNYTYHQAGTFSIRSFATDLSLLLQDAMTSISLSVQSIPYMFSVLCPSMLITYQPYQCESFLMRGTDIQMTVEYTDGTNGPRVNHSLNLGDSKEYSLGNTVQEKLFLPDPSLASVSSTNGKILHRSYPTEHFGFLIGFEYFAIATGNLDLYIYSPSCGSFEYCTKVHGCVSSGTCDHTCPSGTDTFATDIQACSIIGLSNRSSALVTYDLVHAASITVGKTGYGYYDAIGDNILLYPGDIVAHDTNGNAILAHLPHGYSTYSDLYCSNKQGSEQSIEGNTCIVSNEFHQVKAVYSIGVVAKVPVEFTAPGNISMNFTVFNRNNALSGSESYLKNITVMEGVNASVFVELGCLESTVSSEIQLEPFTGSPVTVFWDFGDSTADVGAPDQASISHEFSLPGMYNVSANVTNAFSWKKNYTIVCVQERLNNIRLLAPAVVEVGAAQSLSLTVHSGSDYNCTVTFTHSDSSSETIVLSETDVLHNGTIDKTFSISGTVNINATCWNLINAESNLISINAIERISGIALSPPGAMVNTSFLIFMTLTSGTDFQVNLTYDGQVIPVTAYANRSAISTSPLQETETGPHTVWVMVSNAINNVTDNFTFIIEVAVTNAVIECIFSNEIVVTPSIDYTVIAAGETVSCSVSMTDGTSVEMLIDWGDGSSNFTHSVGQGLPWSTNPPVMPINHTYPNPMYCELNVTLSNAFNVAIGNFPVMVMIGVDNVELDEVSPVAFTPPARVNFTWSVTSGSIPIGVTCDMSYGDGFTESISDCDLEATLPYTYWNSPGELTLHYTIFNYISSKSGNITLWIVTPIVDNICSSNPVAGQPGVPIDLVFVTRRGPGAGILDLTFVCDTAEPNLIGPRKRIYNSPDGKDTESCTYTVGGNYTASVTASSLLETKQCFYTMQILKPVTDQFSITTNTPIDFEEDFTCIVTYTFNYYGLTPDEAWLEFSYGDGQVSAPVAFSPVVVHQYEYFTHGHYTTTIRFYNLASEVIVDVPSGCYADFTSGSVTVLREPSIPVGSEDLPGYGVQEDKFRTDEPLKIYPTLDTGTFAWYEMSISGPSYSFVTNETDEDLIILNITEYGVFNLTIQPMNPLYSGPVLYYSGEVMQPVSNIVIKDYGNETVAYVDRNFLVTMDSYGTAMCLAVDNGINQNLQLYGDATTCATAIGEYNVAPSIEDMQSPFHFRYQYTSEGSYTLLMNAWNIFSNETAQFNFVVSGINCVAPNVNIVNRRRNFRYPLKFMRCKRIKVIGTIDYKCPTTLVNTKEWTLKRWDARYNTEIEEIDIANLTSSVNIALVFEPRYLPYGLYRLNLRVTMVTPSPNGELYFDEAETFIEVTKCNLTVQLFPNGMLRKTVGPASLLTLSPRSNSFDPDVATGQTDEFDYFEMACRDLTDKEVYPNSSEKILPLNYTDLPVSHVDAGGCFAQGPGWLSPFNGSVTFITSILKPEHIYEFFIIGYKDTRSANFTGQVEVAAVEPPDFKIDFKIPDILSSGSEGKFFNPNSQQPLVAIILSDCGGCNYLYEWSVYIENYEYCEIDPDCMMELEAKYLSNFAGGLGISQLALYKELFSEYINVAKFQIRLKITNDITLAVGIASLNLLRNTPPYGGACIITPSVGVVSQTNFSAKCENFTDDDHEIVDYKITCEANGRRTDVCQGSDTEYHNIDMPIGDEDRDILTCFATVTDELGASDTFSMADLQVSGLPTEDFRNLLGDMETSDSDPSDVIDASADLSKTAAYAGAALSQMKKMGQQDEDIDFPEIGCARVYQSTGLDETKARPNAFQTRTTDSEKSLRYERIRNSAAKLVSQLTNTLTKSTVENPSEAAVMVKMIENLSYSKEHLTRATQQLMVQQLQQAVQIMKNYRTSLSVEEIEEMGASIMAACSNIEESAALAVDRPTNDDLESQDAAAQNYDTALDSDRPSIPMYEDTEAQLRVAKIDFNKFDQTNSAADNLAMCATIQTDIIAILANVKVQSDTPTVFSSSGIEVQVFKNDPVGFDDMEISTGGGSIKIPQIFGTSQDTPIIMETSVKAKAGISTDGSAACTFSREMSLSFRQLDGTLISVQDMDPPFEFEISQDPNKVSDDDTSKQYVRPVITEDDEYLASGSFHVQYSRSAIKLQFRFEDESTTEKQLLVLINKDVAPSIDASFSKVKVACMIPSSTSKAGTHGGDNEPDPYTCFIDADIIDTYGTGIWVLGVRELDKSEHDRYPTVQSLPDTEYVKQSWLTNKNFTISYQLKIFQLTCTSRVEGSSTRSLRGLKPLSASRSDNIKCSSTHLTSFAADWLVVPNTIDFSHVFSNADFLKNPTLYVTEIVIFVVYILAMIWARRCDKEDVKKLGLLPLLDNYPHDKYYYEILVDTGMRRHGGTESKVYFILSGEEDETDVREFTNSKRKIFSRGSQDGFLMSVPSSLGALMYLRIWHDNSGQGKMKSWYLNHVIIRDVQTGKKYNFIANRWWAVEEEDGQVDRVIPVAGKEQMTEFSHLFAERASKNLSDGHLWFSVVARPPQSRFTRCQRVSCCLCLLYVSMLANAMFYELATSDSNAYQFGPFAISAEQIYIGIVVNLIVFPINFLIIMLFRKSKPRKLRPSRVQAALQSTQSDIKSVSVNEVNPRVQSAMSNNGRASALSIGLSRLEMSPTPAQTTPVVEKEKKCLLPWGCSIFAWILLWLTVLTSAVFVTFYGITFGDTKCRKWITSMIVSFLMSIFFTQPLKVLLFAIIFSVLIRKPGNDDDSESDEEPSSRPLEDDEEYFHDDDDYRLVAPVKPVLKKPKPPNTKMLEAVRRERVKEIQMWAIVREILFYTFYMTILIVISYRSVNSNSYQYKSSMERVFITTNNTNHTFTKIKNVQDYWIWARSGMLRGLRAGPYYNNYPPFYLRGYINDKQSRIMGYATLRQVRVQAGSCKVPGQVDNIIKECNAPYEMDLEEKGNYGPGWTDISTSNSSRNEYMYTDADILDGYPYWGEMALYSGGGYVVRLDSSYEAMVTQFEQLEQEKWIDEYTRAIFLEFTVYNPSVNLFAITTILSEFRPSGGVFGSYRFEPCMLLPYMNDMLLFQIVCEIIYFAFTVFFVIKELGTLYKQKCAYFKQFWNLIEFNITAMSVTAVVIYFYRLISVQKLTDYFEETNGNGYMKFQYVGYWSEIFQYIIGFLVFLATIKFLKLLRFNKKICLLASTLKASSNNLIHFSIIFNVMFFAFVQVFYLVYLRHLTTFKTFVRASEASIVMMMGKFDIYKMSEVNRWFTQMFLFLFVITITFIVVNMFLSILNESFSSVRNDVTMQQNDYEIVDFILNRFKLWTGLGGEKQRTLTADELEKQRKNARAHDIDEQMAHFDNQIERFLASVSDMYVRKSKFDDFLNNGMYSKMAEKVAAHDRVFPPVRHPAPRAGAIPLNRRARRMSYDAAC